MRPQSLGTRSILAASIAILLALVILGAAVDVLVARHLRGSLDHSLRVRATEIAQLSVSAPALLTVPGSLDSSISGTQIDVEVIDRHGRIVARSLALGGRVLPVTRVSKNVIASGVARFATQHSGTDPLRVYVAPLADAGGAGSGGAVLVAASTHDLAATLGEVHLVVFVAAVLAAIVAAAVLMVTMRRALSPLGRLTVAATQIERSGDPRRRLPGVSGDDEVARLAGTLNKMLAALERSRDSERRFLADASHELRTPLTALLGNVSYLARHGASDELVREISDDAQRLAGLADDLLAIAREEGASLPDEVVRIDRLAEAVDGVERIVNGPIEVRGDKTALERALANLVENARRHGKGRIRVEARAHHGVAVLAVRDEGPGLAATDAKHAFGRFWRGPNAGAGSGLGLAIVRATAERHGGTVTVDGSRFAIELPLLREVSESGATTKDVGRKGAS